MRYYFDKPESRSVFWWLKRLKQPAYGQKSWISLQDFKSLMAENCDRTDRNLEKNTNFDEKR